MDDWKNEVSERRDAIRDEHAGIVDVVVVDCGWESNITICIFDKKGSSELERHLPIPHINAPPNSSSHLALDHWPWPRFTM
jgi:hypothetical protein